MQHLGPRKALKEGNLISDARASTPKDERLIYHQSLFRFLLRCCEPRNLKLVAQKRRQKRHQTTDKTDFIVRCDFTQPTICIEKDFAYAFQCSFDRQSGLRHTAPVQAVAQRRRRGNVKLQPHEVCLNLQLNHDERKVE